LAQCFFRLLTLGDVTRNFGKTHYPAS
jgi:hypothetical protein